MAEPLASADKSEPLSGKDELFRRLKSWFRADSEHSAEWRREAKEDYDFVAGHQWDDKDVNALKEAQRPVITFNRVDPLIRSVVGEQINNGQETRYLPREQGDVQVNEVLTEAARWFRDQCDADDEESDAFYDNCVTGIGCTDTRLEMEEDPEEPMPAIERCDPLEMYWDCDARKRNLADARRVWRVRDIPITTARDMFPDAIDADLDANWASTVAADGEKSKGDDRDEYSGSNQGDDPTRKDDDAQVTIVQVQWTESETFYKVEIPQPPQIDPQTGQPIQAQPQIEELDEAKYRERKAVIKAAGLKVVKLQRKGYRKAFLGRKILKEGPLKCPHFTFQFITGFRDRNKGTFYGIVRAMKDPQRWANKWLSQTLHIMNSTAKGGVMMEAGAVDDQREFERTFAKPDAVTWVPDNTLAPPGGGNPKIIPKPTGTFPAGFFQLMQFAISSVRDVAGINLEMLGMREADQPASLEWQRRQSGMTILATLFRSMRRYHRTQGKVMLYYIQNFLSDGRLVRIVGKEGAQYVPLVKQADAKYDIIVDEGPSSPNQKERVWGMVGAQFWELPPPIQMALLEYSPFPESVVAKVKEAATQAQNSPAAQMQDKLLQLEAMLTEAKVLLTKAQAGKAQADTQAALAEIGMPGPGPDVGAQATDRMKVTLDAQNKAEDRVSKERIEGAKIAADVQVNREWIQSEEKQAAVSAVVSERQGERQAATAAQVAKTRSSRPQPSSRP